MLKTSGREFVVYRGFPANTFLLCHRRTHINQRVRSQNRNSLNYSFDFVLFYFTKLHDLIKHLIASRNIPIAIRSIASIILFVSVKYRTIAQRITKNQAMILFLVISTPPSSMIELKRVARIFSLLFFKL